MLEKYVLEIILKNVGEIENISRKVWEIFWESNEFFMI